MANTVTSTALKTNSLTSRFYNDKQLASLQRLGDVLIPRYNDFPAFSEVGCIAYIDEVMESAKPQDIKDFGLLLSVMRFLPKFMLAGIVKLAVNADKTPEFIAPLLRQLNIGIRGVVYTLYYANVVPEGYQGKQPNDVIDYHVSCKPDK